LEQLQLHVNWTEPAPARKKFKSFLREYWAFYSGFVLSTTAPWLIYIVSFEIDGSTQLDRAVLHTLSLGELMNASMVLGWVAGFCISGTALQRRDRARVGSKHHSVFYYAGWCYMQWIVPLFWLGIVYILLYKTLRFIDAPENGSSAIPLIAIPMAIIALHAAQMAFAERYFRSFLRFGFTAVATAMFLIIFLVPGPAASGAWIVYILDAGGGIPVTALIRQQPEGAEKSTVTTVSGCLVLWVGNQFTIQQAVGNGSSPGSRCRSLPAPGLLDAHARSLTVSRTDVVAVLDYGRISTEPFPEHSAELRSNPAPSSIVVRLGDTARSVAPASWQSESLSGY
jgi:hypothetical protein